MNKQEKIDILCKAILDEAKEKGYMDFNDPSYNKDFMVQIDLTIEEIRLAYKLYIGNK